MAGVHRAAASIPPMRLGLLLRLSGMLALVAPMAWSAETIEATVRFDRAPPPAVLLWVPGDAGWKPDSTIVIDQKDRAFHPQIAVAPTGSTIDIRNSDDQQHNVFSLDPDVDLGLGQPGSLLHLTVAWPAGTVVKHGCKIHPQMQLWVAALDTPYHAVTELPESALSGIVRIAGVPAERTQAVLWAPRCDQLSVTIPCTDVPVLRKGRPVGTLSVHRVP